MTDIGNFDRRRYAQLIANPGPRGVGGLSIAERMPWALMVAERKAEIEQAGFPGYSRSGKSLAARAAYARRRAQP